MTLDDVSGSLHAVTGIIALRRANILNIVDDWLEADVLIGKAKVVFTVEMRGNVHIVEIFSVLRGRGYDVHGRTED